MSFDPTGKTVDQILDYGAPGLRYWESFLPLYTRAFGAPHGLLLADLYARYDEQRGTNLAEFDTARAELDKALTAAEARWASHRAVAQSLPAAWTGATGAEALTILNSQLRQAREDLDTTRAATAAIAAALEPLRKAALTKAEVTRALLEPTPDGEGRLTIDGKTPDDIEALLSDPADPWLTGTFRPDLDRKLTTFTAACDTADHTFEAHYRTILTALSQVIDHPYPQPAQTLLPHPDPPSTPAAPQPFPPSQRYPDTSSPPAAYPQPSRHPAPATADSPRSAEPVGSTESPEIEPVGEVRPTPTAPETRSTRAASTEPTASPNPATSAPPETAARSTDLTQPLKDALDQLETGIQQGISTALGNLGSHTAEASPPSATPDSTTTPEPQPEPDSPRPPALPSGRLEFDLAGKHFVLERTPEGKLSLTMTDESGRTQTLTFDPNGNPAPNLDNPAAGEHPEAASPPAAIPDPPSSADSGPRDQRDTDQPAPHEVPEPPATDRDMPVCPCPPTAQTTPDGPSTVQGVCPNPDSAPSDTASGPDRAAPPHPPAPSAMCTTPQDPPPAPPVCEPSPVESDAPTPSLDAPGPPEVSPPAAEPPTNPAPALGSPDAPVEIPEGGVEIPETPSLVGPSAQ